MDLDTGLAEVVHGILRPLDVDAERRITALSAGGAKYEQQDVR
jgi:hypothetical protein